MESEKSKRWEPWACCVHRFDIASDGESCCLQRKAEGAAARKAADLKVVRSPLLYLVPLLGRRCYGCSLCTLKLLPSFLSWHSTMLFACAMRCWLIARHEPWYAAAPPGFCQYAAAPAGFSLLAAHEHSPVSGLSRPLYLSAGPFASEHSRSLIILLLGAVAPVLWVAVSFKGALAPVVCRSGSQLAHSSHLESLDGEIPGRLPSWLEFRSCSHARFVINRAFES